MTLLALSAFANLLGIQMETMPLLRLFALFSIGLLGVILLAGLGMFWRISRLATAPYAMVKATAGRNTLQSLAVVFQLVASIVFIVATLVVTNQMNYVRHKDLGFEQKGLLYLSGIQPFLEENIHEALKKTMLSIPQIESITYADFTPQHQVNPFRMTTNVEWEGKESSNEQAFNYIVTDSNFDDVFHVKMLAGQWLAENGEDNIVLNETAVRVMGLENPIGSVLRIKLNEEKTYRVVGVVKDFHTTSLRNQILPTFFTSSPYPMNNIYFRTVPGQEQEAIARMNAALPGIDASFSDASPLAMTTVYDRLNNSEQVAPEQFRAGRSENFLYPGCHLPGNFADRNIRRRPGLDTQAAERNRHPQGDGSHGRGYRPPFLPRICGASRICRHNRLARSVFGDGELVAGLCLPHGRFLGDVDECLVCRPDHCPPFGLRTGVQSSQWESGGGGEE